MSKIKLNVLGLSYSQTQGGAYALVLTEENNNRRIPIIIGGFEAQAIAIELEGLKPPRPLTHDLFLSFAKVFNIKLIEVNIYKLEEGIFYSNLIIDNGTNKFKIDARTSDAVALALRFKCPIYTTEEILAKAGIILDVGKTSKQAKKEKLSTDKSTTKDSPGEFTNMSIEELQELIGKAISNENYEKASKIRDEINRRNKKT